MGDPAALRRMSYELCLNELLKACIPVIVTETRELASVKECVEEVAKHLHKSLFYYIPDGNIQCRIYNDRKTRNPSAIAENFSKQVKNQNCSLEDFITRVLEEPANPDISRTSIPQNSIIVISGITKEMFSNKMEELLVQNITDGILANNKISILFTNDIISLPDKIRRLAMEDNFNDITEDERYEFIKKELEGFTKELEIYAKKKKQAVNKNRWMFKQDCLREIARKAHCLTLYETRNILNLCLVKRPTDENVDEIIHLVEDFSSQALANNHALQAYAAEEGLDKIGNFDRVIDYLKERASAFVQDPKATNIDLPRGIVLLGLPGTGKSMMANMVGNILGLPTLHLRTQDVFNLYVGVSEERIRSALNQVDALNGCVLVIDEADKQFAGNAESTDADNGVTARVFGVILEWLQEHKSKTFVVMTMNATKDMPPELMRAGRFDAVFFADLPTREGRKRIFNTFWDDNMFTKDEWETIISDTHHFVGSEIRWVVQDAHRLAHSRSQEIFRQTRRWKELNPNISEVLQAIQERKPLYLLERNRLEKIREKYSRSCLSVSYDDYNMEQVNYRLNYSVDNEVKRLQRIDAVKKDIKEHPEKYGVKSKDGLLIDMGAEALWKAEHPDYKEFLE